MKQGFLDYHNHNDAWVSGSVYFQIPRNLSKNEAAIKFTCNYENYPKMLNGEISIEEGMKRMDEGASKLLAQFAKTL